MIYEVRAQYHEWFYIISRHRSRKAAEKRLAGMEAANMRVNEKERVRYWIFEDDPAIP